MYATSVSVTGSPGYMSGPLQADNVIRNRNKKKNMPVRQRLAFMDFILLICCNKTNQDSRTGT